MDAFIQVCAVYLVVAPVVATIYLIYRQDKKGRRNYIYILILSGLLALIVATISSRLFENPRPYISDGITPLFYTGDDNGFPSSHTLLAATLGFAALYYSRKIGMILLVLTIVIGWARVAAGVHHGIDIVGAFVVSGLSVWLVATLMRNYNKDSQKEPSKKHNKPA